MPSSQASADASLVLRHDMADMPRLADWITGRCEALGLTSAPTYALRLCLEEAVSNIMTHSVPQPGLLAEIDLIVERNGHRLTVDIFDHGAPFDPLSFVTAPRVGNLRDAPAGGLGIPLMRHYCPAISYRREGGTNRLTMHFDQAAGAF